MRTGRRVSFAGAGLPLDLSAYDVPNPPADGLLVRVQMAGVCGTDVHLLDEDAPVPQAGVAMGHEGVGSVEQLGELVTSDWAGQPLRAGDLVFWNPAGRCGRCHLCCTRPQGITCANMPWPPSVSAPNAAAFQDYATLSGSVPVYRVPDDTPPDAIIAFGCAMPAALGGFSKLGSINAGDVVVIQGCGPVGLAATMLAALSPASQVIVIGGGRRRLGAARSLGATSVISIETTGTDDRKRAVDDLTHGHGGDVVIEAAGQLPAFAEGLDLLAYNGRYLILGLFAGSGSVAVNPFRLNNRNLSLIGCYAAVPAAHLKTIQLIQRHHNGLKLSRLVSSRFPLGEVTSAIQAMREGQEIKVAVMPAAG